MNIIIAAMIILAAGAAATSHAQENAYVPLHIDLKVTEIVREHGTSVDRYTVTADITNHGIETLLLDLVEIWLDTDIVVNDCQSSDFVVGPGQTKEFVGCYTGDAKQDPTGMAVFGYGPSFAEGERGVHLLSFVESECDHTSDDASCQSGQRIDHITQHVEPTIYSATDESQIIDDTDTSEVTVSAASYDWDSNTLVISFTDTIGPLVDMSNINVVDSRCATAFSPEEYRGRGQDRMSVTIEPNDIQRRTLAGMSGPDVYIHRGAFHDTNGAILDSTHIQMTTAGAPPSGNNPCIITYGSNELLLEVHAHNYTQTLQAVHDGFAAWSELNPGLEFVWVERNPLIWIEWAEYQPEYVGLACVWCLGYEATMDIILYGYNCKSERIHYTPDSIRNTISHELGHILGLEHHIDQTHLMHGTDFVLDPFPTLGYAIPDLLPEGFVGEAELVSRQEDLKEMLDPISDELDRLDRSLEQFASRHGDKRGNTIYFDTNAQVRQYNSMVGEYNGLLGEYRDLADEHNAIVDDLNCMYEAKPPGH